MVCLVLLYWFMVSNLSREDVPERAGHVLDISQTNPGHVLEGSLDFPCHFPLQKKTKKNGPYGTLYMFALRPEYFIYFCMCFLDVP